MRICLIGEYAAIRDEGMRNMTVYLTQELSKWHQVLALDITKVLTPAFWKGVRHFNPDVIHYVHGATMKSFILMKVLSFYCRKARTVISVVRPFFSPLEARFIPLLRPDLVLTQSQETEDKLHSLGCQTEFLPSGVDTTKFAPVDSEVKGKLREKYGIDDNKFMLLHVGSIKPGRGVQLLAKLQKEDTQVIIVGSSSVGINEKVLKELKKASCLVWTEYFENIEEIYALADCYIFPTVPLRDVLGRPISDSIEMPLSVLEAMSCNLPVITNKFGALPRVFEEGDGFYFTRGEDDFTRRLQESKMVKAKTREKVLPYSWENITRKLEKIYEKVIAENNATCESPKVT